MTWIGNTSAAFSSGDTAFNISHVGTGPHDDKRTVLAINTQSTVSVTAINVFPGGAPSTGWTLRSTSVAQGRKWWLYDKICGPGEPTTYTVWLSPAATNLGWALLADFSTGGDAIRAVSYADNVAASTLTVPSLTAVRADDILSLAWSDDADNQQLRPDSPLVRIGGPTQGPWHFESGREVWQSSSATGTRSYTMQAGAYDKAVGVMMLVGDYDPPVGGGWAVGMVRMGAN
jgi:hypothetical protein